MLDTNSSDGKKKVRVKFKLTVKNLKLFGKDTIDHFEMIGTEEVTADMLKDFYEKWIEPDFLKKHIAGYEDSDESSIDILNP